MKGEPPKPQKVAEHEERLVQCLDQIEKVWLHDKMFLTGYQLTIADLLGACEIEQTREYTSNNAYTDLSFWNIYLIRLSSYVYTGVAGYDPREGRPHLSAWLDRVSRETAPYYQEAHAFLNKLAEKANREKRSRL